MAIIYSLSFSSGKQYVGMTTELMRRRLASHRSYAKKGCNSAVYRAWRKYGEPEAKVLAVVEDHMVRETEQKAIAIFQTMAPHGYNLLPGGEGSIAEEARQKMSLASKGRPKSPEHRMRISIGQIGRPGTWTGKKQSAEHVEKRIAGHRGATRSPEARAKMSAAWAAKRVAQSELNS